MPRSRSPVPNVPLETVVFKLKVPLHAQVRNSLRNMILNQFEPGQQFFTEYILREKLKVSQATVRRALNDLVVEGMLDRHAGKGTFVRFKNPLQRIDVLVSDYQTLARAMLMNAIQEVCFQKGIRFEICPFRRDVPYKQILATLHGPPLENGVIVLGGALHENVELNFLLENEGYRHVFTHWMGEGFSGKVIAANESNFVEIALDHLTGLGHRRIVMLQNEPHTLPLVQRRTETALQLKAKRGLSDFNIVDCNTPAGENSGDYSYRKMDEIMKMNPPPTAIFTTSDRGAFSVLKYLSEKGIKVPEKVSVMGANNIPTCEQIYPRLTSIARPIQEISKECVKYIADSRPNKESDLFQPELVVRESTGPCHENKG